MKRFSAGVKTSTTVRRNATEDAPILDTNRSRAYTGRSQQRRAGGAILFGNVLVSEVELGGLRNLDKARASMPIMLRLFQAMAGVPRGAAREIVAAQSRPRFTSVTQIQSVQPQ